ncbi:MAG: hypothetical protein HOI75_02285 [Euryarchaeota archaeon]|nr:hypothetical protein [Euryarchaeota archaeon]
METKNPEMRPAPAPLLGWLIAPLAVLLALAAIQIVGMDFDLNLDNMAPMLVVLVAASLGLAPRLLKASGTVSLSSSTLSLVSLVVALVGAQLVYMAGLAAVTALLFFIVMFGVHLLATRGAFEWANVLMFAAVGVELGFVAAGHIADKLNYIAEDGLMLNDQAIGVLDAYRGAVGYQFFSYLMLFVILGMLVSVLARGVLSPSSEKGWFSHITDGNGAWNKSTLPLQIGLAVWALAHIASLWQFNYLMSNESTMLNLFGPYSDRAVAQYTDLESYHGYFGFWSAFFTGMVALLVAGMASERWFTRSMFVGSMWVLYLVSSAYENGMWTNENFSGSWGALIWLAFTFFISAIIYVIGTGDKWGGWSNRSEYEPSGARRFWNAHWASIMVGMALFFGFVIRVQWYVIPSMNSLGTNTWDMTGGSDPWYMKRVVDYILANNAHLIFDADRTYPIGGINPRPPLFTWSIAVLASLLQPFVGSEDAVWWSMLTLPAIYGAFTILPVAAIAREHINEKAGVVAAWLIAFMPAHVSHSTFALADHDAFIMLFLTMGFMYWLKALKYAGSDRLLRTTSPSLATFVESFTTVASQRTAAFSYAVLAGVSFGVVSLGWKGFVVGPSILFLAYALQVALNMFRRRDSTTINVLFISMLAVNFLMAIPFYAHPQLNLVTDGTGLLPLLFIAVFTITIAFVTTGFRDKPWLLVLGVLAGGSAVFFSVLYILKLSDVSSAWDVLFTGGGYFAKSKIFGTIAEANATDRGQLFAQFGPITFLLALVMGILCLVSGLRERKQTNLVFGVWIIAASYMAWSAARFMFNATPAMAILGAWGIISLWKWANWDGMVRSWKKYGIRTPEDRIRGARKAIWRTPNFSAILLIMIMLFGQQATYGLDAALPATVTAEDELDETIYNLIPDILRQEIAGFSLLDDEPYNGDWYLGTMGSGFNDNSWNNAYEWLAQQDSDQVYSDRPAFVSWWDYGFQALASGEHPSVSDNFQTGIPATGNMLLAQSESDLISMFIWQLAEGDIAYNTARSGDYEFTNGFSNILANHLTADQHDMFESINMNSDRDALKTLVIENSFKVLQTNRDIVMAQGYHQTDGLVDSSTMVYRLYDDKVVIECTEQLSESCQGTDWTNKDQAQTTFNNNVRSSQDTAEGTSHYVINDYWYTADMINEFNSVSTHIHRMNARLAVTVQLLTNVMDESEIVDLYEDLITDLNDYEVQDYNGAPGETILRDHEIRYFAIDSRLYPRAGRYTADMGYNQGQPMGIFGAPTILSGQDIGTFMDEVYETSRGEFQDEMTREEVDAAITEDFLNQQAGADIDPLQVQDVRVDHNPQFFNTMLANTYVGYGASTLGIDAGSSNPQPAQHFGQQGSPGSALSQALPLPGAMSNHFVISNWYDADPNISIANTNTYVKILKYYSGAEISGQVSMSDNGQGLPGVRLLIERDAFSGEDAEDLDSDTYWVPIGFVDADDEGHWSFDAPAGRIRVSAFAGEYNPIAAQDSIRTGAYVDGLADILTETNTDRKINDITAILGEVANMTWLGASQMNVTGDQADRIELITEPLNIDVQSSGVSGLVSWSGAESFNGDPLVDTTFVLRSIWSLTENYTLTTTNGSFTSEDSRILQGSGEATFTENGTFESEGVAFAQDFTGTFTRAIADKRTYTSNGTWNGVGSLEASWIANETVMDCTEDNGTYSMPTNETICVKSTSGELTTYMLDGEINANGRLTSEGVSTLRTELVNATFEATGSFEGTGTLNGTGLFIGKGHFAGSMVQPGSFYITGLVPGLYNMIAQLDNGKEVLLPDPVDVGINPSYDLDMTMPGSLFEDTLEDFFGEVYGNETIELIDTGLGEEYAIDILTDENGTFSYGPLAPGDYFYRVDIDNDGWYEINSTMFVRDDSENFTLEMDVPEMHDVTVQLVAPVDAQTQAALISVAERVVTFTNDDSMMAPINATSDATGVVYIELPMGAYTMSDDADDDYILFSTFELEQEDLSIDGNYAVSTWVNGTIRTHLDASNYDQWAEGTDEIKLAESDPASGLTVDFIAGDLEFSTVTNVDGNYSMRLPNGQDFHMTTISTFSTYTGGQLIELNAEDEIDMGIMYLAPATSTSGFVFLYENTSLWDNLVPGWAAQTLIASNEDGLEWRTEITEGGEFTFFLQDGNWDFNAIDAELNITGIENFNVSRATETAPSPLELFAHPAHQEVTLQFFMDAGDDGVLENGTMVSPAFSAVPLNNHGTQMNYTSADYTSPGVISITLEPGTYSVELNFTTPDSENASDYALAGVTALQPLVVGLDAIEESLDMPLRNDYLVTGTLTNESGDAIEKQFLLYEAEQDLYFNLESDVNGTFAGYVPAGDWVAIVAPFIANENATEILRAPLTIAAEASTRTGLAYSTVETVEVMFQLQETASGNNMSNVRVTAVSHDGYGNITLTKSNETGMISESMMPGTWSLFLNETAPQRHWMMDTSSAPFTTADATNGSLDLGVVNADLEVEIGGKIFWDLNEDDTPGLSEGVEGFLVDILGTDSGIDTNVTTDENGVWSLFVPVEDNYTVSVSKEGFDTESYNLSNSSAYPVANDPESHDLEVIAGNVAVSGNVTDINDASRLDGATIVLYPTLDAVRDPVTITGTLVDDVLMWDANIAPGEWIVVVTEANAGENGGGVAVGLLDATIATGATLDLEMALGGWVDLDTTWDDFELGTHHAGSADNGSEMIEEAVEITISIGDDLAWNMPVSADGTLTLLMPADAIDFDSTFVTIQHDDMLEMEYIAGSKTSVGEGRSPVTMSYTRSINSDSSLTMVNSTLVNATVIDNIYTDLMAQTLDEGYKTIEFNLDVAYDGTELSDVFTVTGSIGVAPDSSLWSVEFYNGTDWVESYDLTLGVGANASDDSVDKTAIISARIHIANQSEAWNLEDAHMVKVRMSTSTGESSEIAVNVQVPQTYGLEITDEQTELGIAEGSSRQFSFMLTNTGNGDDSFTIQLADNIPEGWEVTPMQSVVTIAKDDMRSQAFTVFAPSTWDGVSKTVSVTVTSEDGTTTESFDVTVQQAKISLRFADADAQLASDRTADVENSIVRLPIENFGYLDAESVIVSLVHVGGETFDAVTISIPALSTVNAEFNVGEMKAPSQRFEYHVEVAGEQANLTDVTITDGDFKINYDIVQDGNDSPWLTVGIVVLALLVGYGGIKISRSGSGAKRF